MSKRRILIINGSLRQGSSTSVIVKELSLLFSHSVQVDLYEDLGSLPHFNDPNNVPESVLLFRTLLQQSDGVLICTPEYAFGVPGSLKNALDWTVSSGSFEGKPVAVVTAATSGVIAHAGILDVLKALGATVDIQSTLLISFIRSKLKDNQIIDQDLITKLKLLVEAFLRLLNQPPSD